MLWWLFKKSWIFDVFQPNDTSNHLIEIGYPLWFVYQIDTLDDLISIGYSLWLIEWLDSLNDLIYSFMELEHCIRLIHLSDYVSMPYQRKKNDDTCYC